MNQLLLNPRARITDPDTSHLAADTVVNVTELHQAIYTIILHHGPIDDTTIYPMVRKWINASDSSVRTRRHELVEMGYVREFKGAHGESDFGRATTLWNAVT